MTGRGGCDKFQVMIGCTDSLNFSSISRLSMARKGIFPLVQVQRNVLRSLIKLYLRISRFWVSTEVSTHHENLQRKVVTEVRDGKRGKIRFFLSNSLSQSNFIYKLVPIMYKSITCNCMSFGFYY